MNDKEKAALGSIAASAGLTAAKAIVGLLSGSLAILSEAAHSLLDLAATILTYVAVRVSGKPADDEHQYGHGKVESVAALAETALLFLLSRRGLRGGAAAPRRAGHAVEATAAAFAVIAVSIVVDFFRARALDRVAGKTSSQALEADALHFSSDMWSSIAVLVGLGGVALGYSWADAAAALVVAVFICVAGWRLGRRTIDTLTDAAPAGVSERDRGDRAARPRRGRGRARARAPGRRDAVRRARRRREPHAAARSRRRDQGATRRAPSATSSPSAEVTITTEPRALDDETILERVMLIARNGGLAVHHVTVQALARSLVGVGSISRSTARCRLRAAHDTASRLEEAIRDELGPDVEVETHIEPLPAGSRRPRRPTAPRRGIGAALRGARQRRGRASATCTTCACARPPTARSSISTAASIRR